LYCIHCLLKRAAAPTVSWVPPRNLKGASAPGPRFRSGSLFSLAIQIFGLATGDFGNSLHSVIFAPVLPQFCPHFVPVLHRLCAGCASVVRRLRVGCAPVARRFCAAFARHSAPFRRRIATVLLPLCIPAWDTARTCVSQSTGSATSKSRQGGPDYKGFTSRQSLRFLQWPVHLADQDFPHKHFHRATEAICLVSHSLLRVRLERPPGP
jgi:hypothetical protein